MKRLVYTCLFLSGFLLFTPGKLAAQIRSETPVSMISAAINSDAFSGMELGYQQSGRLISKPVGYYIKFNFPLASTLMKKKLDAWEIRIGSAFPVFVQQKWELLSDISLFTIRHKQSLGTFVPFGFEAKLTPACRTRSGYWGVQFRFRQALFTYMRHSSYVRERFQEIYDKDQQLVRAAPRNGFYSFTGSQLQIGIEGRFPLSGRSDMYLDLGMTHFFSPYTGAFNAMMYGQVPFYMSLQFNYKLQQDPTDPVL